MSTSKEIDRAAKRYMYYLIKAGENNLVDGNEVLEWGGSGPFTDEEKDEIYSRIDELIDSVTP